MSGFCLQLSSGTRIRASIATTWNDAFHKSSVERKRLARDRLIALARLMDSAIEVPGLRRGVGLDALLGLVPVAGEETRPTTRLGTRRGDRRANCEGSLAYRRIGRDRHHHHLQPDRF
ncbi:MAG: DUF4112 domain-containing protein [Casimicrobiaceae bacterium]